jgi:hypothetical protein
VKPWFEDLPPDFARTDTRAAEKLLAAAYPHQMAAVTLAQNAGLDLARLNTMKPVVYLMRDILEEARRSDRLLGLVAEVLADPTQSAFHDDLRALVAGHEDAVRDAALHRKPSLATLTRLPSAVEVWGGSDENPSPLTTGLEKTINAAAGFADPAVFRLRLAEAEVRTARIEVGGKAQGTGFLVGADLLLTNWHVVKRAGDGALARFDHGTAATAPHAQGRPVRFADDWLVAHSSHEPVPVETSASGPPEGTWDFALVRLAQPVGRQPIGPDPTTANGDLRGYYVLDGDPYSFHAAEPLFILGHPEGRPVQLSYASPAGARLTAAKNRIRYDTNTEGGSSGSPVFNREWRVVALHHASGPTTIPGDFHLRSAGFNQGVPISGVVQWLRKELESRPELVELGLA